MNNNDDETLKSPRRRRVGRVYLAIWKALVAATIVLGSVVALMAYGPLSAALVFTSSAFMAGIWIYVFTLDDHWETRSIVELGLLAAAAVTAVAGLSTVIGGWSAGIVVILVAVSPTVLRWLRIVEPASTASSTSRPPAPSPVGPTDIRRRPMDLDDAELCRAWRDTGKAMGTRHSVRVTMELVEYRMLCLDEIERRNPKSSLDWLVDGPPLSVDAKSYLPPGIVGRSS